jgi:Trypsin-co-occurring domain 2
VQTILTRVSLDQALIEIFGYTCKLTNRSDWKRDLNMVAKQNEENGSTQLGLTELVSALRKEIEAAQAQFAEGRQPMFFVQSVEAEVSFVVEKSISAGGGVHIYFVAVDAKRDCKAGTMHKLKIALRPPSNEEVGFAGNKPSA